ncbi:CHAT domain-containing protein [Oscillatoria sp. FACHB-1407]|uniref:CHAT domain-containing protein n=1 Tax=Oscillatoria sp. FACHB-1407 TaxID=2692847 RepID=UPI0016888E5E|nr:CHAT domain-containing protein [Oscillatoria sp. FACHB-1407]MBD2463973.1 CHAT domain-containing protein [Oscillatoria sp. FACHB-1407]
MRSPLQKHLLTLGSLLLGLVLTLVIGSVVAPASSTTPAPADAVRSRITEIEQTWQNQYNTHFNTSLAGTPLTADAINSTLARLNRQTGKKLALIYAFPQPDALELVLVIPGQPAVQKRLTDVPRTTLIPVINGFLNRVASPVRTRLYLEPARQLYQWIIAPLEADLQAQAIDTLVFCVGENLRSLPFAALHDGQQFLIEKYSVGLIPAFSLTNPNYNRLRQLRVLAMGASEFQGLEDLPAVPLELSAITQDRQGRVFLNRQFTLENLRRQLTSQAFGIVHLATHAEFNPGEPDKSYIQLWQGDRLDLDQLRRLDWRDLPVELLVLSACQTALGDREAELGFAGLSFQSGVKSSLASLWRVSDTGTLALMREFYGQLANPEVTTKAEALRRTQIAMLKGQIYIENDQLHNSNGAMSLPDELSQSGRLTFVQPYFWSAFTLVGSPW